MTGTVTKLGSYAYKLEMLAAAKPTAAAPKKPMGGYYQRLTAKVATENAKASLVFAKSAERVFDSVSNEKL